MTNEKKQFSATIGKITNGMHVGQGSDYSNNLVIQFGCNACAWRDTPMCPHGLVYPKTHSNKICSKRALYIKETFNIVHSKARVVQVEESVRLKLLLDKLTSEFAQENILSPELAKLSKNLITLLDKMRRQDEGIKMQADISVDVHDFRKVVDEQAKALNGKSILEAEYVNKPDNEGTKGKSREEV